MTLEIKNKINHLSTGHGGPTVHQLFYRSDFKIENLRSRTLRIVNGISIVNIFYKHTKT